MVRAISRWLALPLAGALALPALASCSAAQEVRSFKCALDASNDRPRTTFFTDTETFYCNVEFIGQRRDTTLQIYIRQVRREQTWGGNLEACNVLLTGAESAPSTGSSVQSLNIKRPEATDGSSDVLPFPVGVFQAEAVVNGVVQATTQFQITYPTPDCPALAVLPGTLCRGFNRPNAKCTAADQAVKCTCNANTGRWDC